MGNILGQEPITLFLMLAALGMLPFIAILVTPFAKIIIVLTLTRNALGLQQVPPTLVLNAIALILTAYIMAPVAQAAYAPMQSRFAQSRQIDLSLVEETVAAGRAPLLAFLQRHV